ncbi:MAG: hypothetical protein ACKPEY_14820, partial [Planctomycetota bacterium]
MDHYRLTFTCWPNPSQDKTLSGCAIMVNCDRLIERPVSVVNRLLFSQLKPMTTTDLHSFQPEASPRPSTRPSTLTRWWTQL